MRRADTFERVSDYDHRWLNRVCPVAQHVCVGVLVEGVADSSLPGLHPRATACSQNRQRQIVLAGGDAFKQDLGRLLGCSCHWALRDFVLGFGGAVAPVVEVISETPGDRSLVMPAHVRTRGLAVATVGA